MKIVVLFCLTVLSLHQCNAAESASVVYSQDSFAEAKGKLPLFVKFYAPWWDDSFIVFIVFFTETILFIGIILLCSINWNP